MAERKQTPDILGEILEGAVLPSEPGPTVPASQRTRSAEQRGAAAPGPHVGTPYLKTVKWEYLVVSLQQHGGWRARYVNGVELSAWSSGPLIHDYLAARGEEGWELAASSSGERMYGNSDAYQLFFKRPVLSDSTHKRS